MAAASDGKQLLDQEIHSAESDDTELSAAADRDINRSTWVDADAERLI